MSAAELLAWSGAERLDEAIARDLSGLLRQRGLRASPDLFSVLAERGEERWDPAFDTSGLSVERDRLEQTTLTVHPTRLPALLGVALLTGVVASIAWYESAGLGLLAVAVGAATGWALWHRFGLLDQRLPRAVPRSEVLGAGLAALSIGAVLVAVAVVRLITGL